MINKHNARKENAHLALPPLLPRKNNHKHLTVHMVAHTHDDVGWLKTYEEYYTGMENTNSIKHSRVE